MAKDTSAPVYQAYTVIKREGQDDFFLGIGAAFEHRDQRGLNVILQALPIDGKIVLRAPKSEGESNDHGSNRDDRNTRSRNPPRQRGR